MSREKNDEQRQQHLKPIAFSPPDIREEDIDAVVQVLRSGWITSGSVSRTFERELVEASRAAEALLTSSATTAMETILRLLGIGPGDEVITTAYTFTASAAVIAHVGATIRLVDTAPGQFVPSVADILGHVTDRTKAVITVDLGGVMFDHESLAEALGVGPGFVVASELQEAIGRVAVVADAAHSLGASLRGRASGSAADFSAHSFHAVKNVTTAEGGAIIWRTLGAAQDERIRSQAQRMIMHGQTKDAHAKLQLGSWEYDIMELGHKFNLPDTAAALGLSQFRRNDEIVARRHEIVAVYESVRAGTGLSTLVHTGPDFRSSAHLYLVLLPAPDVAVRNTIIEGMARDGIAANVHYKPLPALSAYRDRGFRVEDFPNAMDMYGRVISLPLHNRLTDEDARRVMESLLAHARRAGVTV